MEVRAKLAWLLQVIGGRLGEMRGSLKFCCQEPGTDHDGRLTLRSLADVTLGMERLQSLGGL